MGEILGLGLTHYPPLCGTDTDMAHLLVRTLEDPSIPPGEKDPANWPDLMRSEWDDVVAAAARHRRELLAGFTRVRESLDRFAPDAVVIVGDDQYENFREDLIPPFAVLAYDDLVCRPWSQAQRSSAMGDRPNFWGEPPETEFAVRGRPELARDLTSGLLSRDIDVAYAYRPLHHPSLAHAFINAILFLDHERSGFDHPVVPFAVNCYGRGVVSRRGFMTAIDHPAPPDPPSPSPGRLMAVGEALADFVIRSEWRVALVASSSWSHAFLCDHTWRLRPDTEADRVLYDEMLRSDHRAMAGRSVDDLEWAGQQELLNWFVLWGAMERVGSTLTWSTFVETDVFNSNKVFAIYHSGKEPDSGQRPEGDRASS